MSKNRADKGKSGRQGAKPKKKSRKKAGLHPHVIISGYYGFDNLGDELILKVLIDELKREGLTITVLSRNPRKTAEQYGVRSIHRTNLIDIIDALAQANLFISGGGGLFQDVTGPMSAVYYGGLIHLADYFEVPVCFWGQGVGPLNGGLARSLTASALAKCESITVRDEKSADLVESLTGMRPEVTADPVWLLKMPKPKKKNGGKKKQEAPWKVGVSLRPWPDLTVKRLDAMAVFLNALAEQSGREVEYVLLPFQEKEDTALLQGLASRLEKLPAITCAMPSEEDLMPALAQCDALLGMRFHSLVLGLLAGVPVYGLVYDPKVESLLKQFGLEGTPVSQLETLDAAAVSDYFAHRYPAIDLAPLQARARRNFELIDGYLHMPEAELVI